MLWKFGTNAEFGWERLDGNLTLSQTLFYAKTKSIYKLLHTEMDWNGMRARVIELARVCEREREIVWQINFHHTIGFAIYFLRSL